MLTANGGIPACHEAGPGSRQQRLAATLTNMIPSVISIRVSAIALNQARPCPSAIVRDRAAKTMQLGQNPPRGAACWKLHVGPKGDRSTPHIFGGTEIPFARWDLVASEGGR
jgi:hypothetical protein